MALSLRLDPDWGAVVVRLVGEFDHLSEPIFAGYVRQLLERQHPTVVFDCSQVRFCDVAGVRCLLQAHRQFREAQRAMIVAGVPHAIEEILRIASPGHPITIYDSLEDVRGPAGERQP
jgi:anti-anti-sigma factor